MCKLIIPSPVLTSCNGTGAKPSLAEASKQGLVVAMESKTAPVTQHASNLDHWLHSNALYGVQYVQVGLSMLKSGSYTYVGICEGVHAQVCPC